MITVFGLDVDRVALAFGLLVLFTVLLNFWLRTRLLQRRKRRVKIGVVVEPSSAGGKRNGFV